MADWDLLTPGIGLTSIGIVGVGISLSGLAKTFIDGMHAVSLLTMFIGMIFLASGLFKDGFPSSGKAKSATFITLGFLVTFGFAAAVTVSAQVPSIFAYIGLMIIIAIPATVLTVASYKRTPYLKALAVIFVGAAIVGGSTFYAFGLVTPKPAPPAEEAEAPEAPAPTNIVSVSILPGSSAQGNPDYDPEQLTVGKGDGVEWTNNDNTPHTATDKAEERAFDSSILNPEGKYLLNTAEIDEGDYTYFCQLHPWMEGKLTVGPAGAAETPAGNATVPEGNASQQAAGNQSTSTPAGNASNQSSGNNGTAAPSGGATVQTVTIPVGAGVATNKEFFVPENVETTVGSMVTWKNDDTALHTATSGDAEAAKPDGKFDSGFLNKGQSFSFVFETAGDYPYYCMVHPWMTGTVTVK
jgi:plastocyanin